MQLEFRGWWRVCEASRRRFSPPALPAQVRGELPDQLDGQPLLLAGALEHEESGHGLPMDLPRLEDRNHLGGEPLQGRGPAEAAFREVQREFLERRMGYDAALVSLDLARLLAAEGCTDDLKRLAAELMPVFESRDVHREAIVALLIFQRACEEERLTVELVQQLAAYLRRERRG